MSDYPIVESVVFKTVEGYPGYCVGDDGSVWTLHFKRFGISNIWRKMDGTINRRGYRQFCLSRDGKTHSLLGHTLVLTAFRGRCPVGMECAHWNGKRSDNRLENLRWATRLSNHADKRRHGTILMGERSPMSKLTNADVIEIRQRRAAGEKRASVAKSKGISVSTVKRITARKLWSHI